MPADRVVLSSGARLVISGTGGNLRPQTFDGLYAWDTRFLSSLRLAIGTEEPVAIGLNRTDPSLATFFSNALIDPRARREGEPELSLVRDRIIRGGLHEDIWVLNHGRASRFELSVEFGTDFADVFEVRGGRVLKKGEFGPEERRGEEIAFSYRRENFRAETRIRFGARPRWEGPVARFDLSLGPKEVWRSCLTVLPVVSERTPEVECPSEYLEPPFEPYRRDRRPARTPPPPTGLHRIFPNPPVLETPYPGFEAAYERALEDLRQLTIEPVTGAPIVGAGLPWYLALFGRDSILTAIETKLLGPALMVHTLRTLAGLQATEEDSFREAQPGKIPHEVRHGELATVGQVPHSRYYGSVDATPLFVMLYAEMARWTGDRALIDELLPAAEAALRWCDRYGDADHDGFLEYPGVSGHGLRNQGWKDSDDAIAFPDGSLAEGPIAVVEAQGYYYAARRGLAEVYREIGREDASERLERAAEELKRRFHDRFWLPGERFYALALDGRKRPVDAISSNPGHALWTGIVDRSRARDVVDRLLSEGMYTGWGVRTLEAGMARFNPESYHNGSVWPHDTALAIAGMARYGFEEEAFEAGLALVDAAAALEGHQLPELFAGYPRRRTSAPVPYPAANAPQAWASGAIILSLETLLGVHITEGRLMGRAQSDLIHLALRGVPFRGRRRRF
jgi:glycogen debranching enzyme